MASCGSEDEASSASASNGLPVTTPAPFPSTTSTDSPATTTAPSEVDPVESFAGGTTFAFLRPPTGAGLHVVRIDDAETVLVVGCEVARGEIQLSQPGPDGTVLDARFDAIDNGACFRGVDADAVPEPDPNGPAATSADAVEQAVTIRTTGDELEFVSPTGEVTARARPADVRPELLGSWTVRIVADESGELLDAAPGYSVSLTESGAVSVSGPCGGTQGRFVSDGEYVRFVELWSEAIECTDRVEERVAAGLARSHQWTHDGSLWFVDQAGGRVLGLE